MERNRKGFTIVELVIVIAVIAILATALVPTFGDVIQRAQQAKDIQTVKNMNTALMIYSAAMADKPMNNSLIQDIDDVLAALAEAGYDTAEKLTPACKDHSFYWHKTSGQITYVDEREEALTLIYPEIENFPTSKDNESLLNLVEELTDESADIINPYAGKTISILGDSISTFGGVSNNTAYNSTIGSNSPHYPGMYNLTLADTWWQQVIDTLDMKLCVNNSWAGSRILAHDSSGAYGRRCVNLHNDKTGGEPDVIVVYLGTNDFGAGKSTFGKADDIDYRTLITQNADGSYQYATPQTSCEAYAITLHKIQQRYPNAEIFCMTLLPDRNPDHPTDGRGYGSPAPYNAELRKLIACFGCTLVDLEYCVDRAGEVFDQHFADHRIHPNEKGMDAISDTLISAMLCKQTGPDLMNSNNNKLLDGKKGDLIDSEGDYKLVSDYIEIPEGYVISKFGSITHMDGTNAYCVFYDENKDYISAYMPESTDETVTRNWKYTETPPDIPEGAKYIRIAFNNGLEDYRENKYDDRITEREYGVLEFSKKTS